MTQNSKIYKEAIKKTIEEQDDPDAVKAEGERKRPTRKVKYERIAQTTIPKDVKDMFLRDDWVLRWVRFQINGEEDYRGLGRRINEGFEFVTEKEVPQSFLARCQIQNTKNQKGLITSGDCVLMKADVNLIEDRKRYYEETTDREVSTADLFNLTRNKGFKDLGMKSKITYKEPTSFQD